MTNRIQDGNVATSKVQQSPAEPAALQKTGKRQTVSAAAEIHADAHTGAEAKTNKHEKSLYRWIQTQYLDTAFNTVGFVGWKKFEAALAEQKLAQKGEIGPALQ
jgi:hypothetical protein